MSGNSTIAVTESALLSRAVVLCSDEPATDDLNVFQLLDFFELPWTRIPSSRITDADAGHGYGFVTSADCIADALEHGEETVNALLARMKKARAIYVYGFQANQRSTGVLRFLTGDPKARLKPIGTAETFMNITAGAPQMCGPMSGMRVRATTTAPGCLAEIGPNTPGFQSIIHSDDGEVFFKTIYADIPVFVNMWGGTVDISASSNRYFDVKEFFCEAVPAVMFFRWAVCGATGNTSETSACLIVDDPPLKRRYGFLDFSDALHLMELHNFTTTIAFIPWNWKRTDPATLRIFRNDPYRFSVVVHGCDHTTGEFAVRSTTTLHRKIRTARQRMQSFRRTAAIKTDRIMVFPQGEFSPEAGRALKLNGFVAAVNTEVAPAPAGTSETTIADLWKPAIMKYGTFPVFPRRYPHHGIENFAFDGLLGKPCLIAAHHDAFSNQAQSLVDLVGRLNSLNWKLVWRPLGEAIRRSCMVQHLEDGTGHVQMFASSLTLVNPGAESCSMVIRKKEDDGERIRAVLVNQRRAEFCIDGECLTFNVTLPPGESAALRVVYRNAADALQRRDNVKYRIKVAAKRYLSEFRDNYLSRSDFLHQAANRLTHFIK